METFVPVLTITDEVTALDVLAAVTLLVETRGAAHIAAIKDKGYHPDAPTSLLFKDACRIHALVLAEVDRLQADRTAPVTTDEDPFCTEPCNGVSVMHKH